MIKEKKNSTFANRNIYNILQYIQPYILIQTYNHICIYKSIRIQITRNILRDIFTEIHYFKVYCSQHIKAHTRKNF